MSKIQLSLIYNNKIMHFTLYKKEKSLWGTKTLFSGLDFNYDAKEKKLQIIKINQLNINISYINITPKLIKGVWNIIYQFK